MRVGADDKRPGEGVLFQHYLVDDAGTGPPEAHAEPSAGRFQELIDFVALVQGVLQVRGRANAGLDQVVAVYGGGHGHAVASRLHELQNRHLAGDVLVRDPVGAQVDVAVAGAQVGLGHVVQVGEQQLFRHGQRAVQPGANLLQFFVHLAVGFPHEFRRGINVAHLVSLLLRR